MLCLFLTHPQPQKALSKLLHFLFFRVKLGSSFRVIFSEGATALSEHYDDLEAYIAKRATSNPAFPKMVDAALKERRLLRQLAARKKKLGQ